MRALLKVVFFVLLVASMACCYSTAFCKDQENGGTLLNNSSTKDDGNSFGDKSSTEDDGYSLKDDSPSKDNGNFLRNGGSSDPKFEYGGNFRVRIQGSHGINP